MRNFKQRIERIDHKIPRSQEFWIFYPDDTVSGVNLNRHHREFGSLQAYEVY